MTIQTMDPAQILSLERHLAEAAQLDPGTIQLLQTLADQLHGKSVLPVVGAGCSYDCGMLVATQIGKHLHTAYYGDASYAPQVADPGPNLGALTEAIKTQRGQRAAVEAVGMHDSTLWPPTSEVDPHFCVYRVLTRLSRERSVGTSMTSAMSFNYDCGWQAALLSEGVMLGPYTFAGRAWEDHATILSDLATKSSTVPKGRFILVKAHGCVERYRSEIARDPTSGAEKNIIICADQLNDWGERGWSRDMLRDKAREHILLLIGLSGQDPVIASTLKRVLEEVLKNRPAPKEPRVIVIDREPNTSRLQSLIAAGLGGQPAKPGVVTSVSINGSATTTAVTLVLLVEGLLKDLNSALQHHVSGPKEVRLADDMDARLAALIVSAPAMLRWSYRLRGPGENQFGQLINLQQAAERGYVPLMFDPPMTARALQTREELREALGYSGPESCNEALADHAFVVTAGQAFLPVGLDHDKLKSACRPGGEIDQAKRTLKYPKKLDCILVSDGEGKRRGIHMDTGKEVEVP
jgi:hypothetical protein